MVVFGWVSRDIYPAKPPYFGGRPTWVYLRKFRLNKLSEKEILKKLKEVDSYFNLDEYKVVLYDGYGGKRTLYYKVSYGEIE